MNNQTIETLKKIAAKRVLGLSLTEHEKAMWTLYGDPSDAAYDNGDTSHWWEAVSKTEYDAVVAFLGKQAEDGGQ